MNLDNWNEFAALDLEDMLGEMDRLPEQLMEAWQLGQGFSLPDAKGVEHVLLAGMGGSAIGADLLKAYLASQIRVPVTVWRNYDLPVFVNDRSLVVVSSHSGNTEETLSAFERAQESGGD